MGDVARHRFRVGFPRRVGEAFRFRFLPRGTAAVFTRLPRRLARLLLRLCQGVVTLFRGAFQLAIPRWNMVLSVQ